MEPSLIARLFLCAGAAVAGLCGAASAAEDAAAGETAAAIRRHRMGTIVIRTEPGAAVTCQQLRHEFWFGTAINGRMFRPGRVSEEDRRRYLELFKANFNAAVHENELKWWENERQSGEVSYAAADAMLAWCEANGIPMRGHCLLWAEDRYIRDWVKALDDDALRRRIEARVTEVVKRYRGRIGEYDVNNEMMRKAYYAERLGEPIRAEMFRWARAADPDAVLYVNDYGALVEGPHTEMYARQVEALQAAGAPVGGIGCQGHFSDQYIPDPKVIRQALDRLAKTGLPIRVTEFDMTTHDEQRKARALVDVYTTCFAHPAVEGILMWGFWEGSHWRPQAALWKRDFTPTPAAEAYRDLVFNQWWTRFEGRADADGRCEIPAFFGRHRVAAGGASREVDLRKADRTAEVDFTSPAASTPARP
ncbi:MAG: endo-1,4-beta-xylanase [Planctomycetes bacterium]|nr:endo-1,4-beta-xylanase [Planctomycetota bacterium]